VGVDEEEPAFVAGERGREGGRKGSVFVSCEFLHVGRLEEALADFLGEGRKGGREEGREGGREEWRGR